MLLRPILNFSAKSPTERSSGKLVCHAGGVRIGLVVQMCVIAVFSVAGCGAGQPAPAPIRDSFTGPDELIASERRPSAPGVPWVMTSGSLFRSRNEGWSGRPDGGRGEGATGSAVFRMVSARRDFLDVDVRLRLRVDALTETDRTPKQDFDGAHVWVRYESDRQLYAVSVDRRDGLMIIKKKCPGGPDNGGTYVDLSPPVTGVPITVGQWQEIMVSARNLQDGSVMITGSRDGHRVSAVDRGTGCAPLRGGGGVGLRGDNAELRIDDVKVDPAHVRH
jgi:hypothetical protein